MTLLVALTGATGFIGSNLADFLLKRGIRLRLLTRRPPPPSPSASHADGSEPMEEWVHGDLADANALGRLVEGVDAVVHCAGSVRGSSLDAFLRVNAEGTRLLAEAAVRTSPRPRFLLVSSLAAREPQLSWYSRSKREGEKSLEEVYGGRGMTVFRPTAVHGPGDEEMAPLFRAMRLGILPVLGPRGARVTLLHVQDLVEAIGLWLDSEDPPTGTFELHDGHEGGYDWPGVAALAGRIWGRRVRTVPVPGSVLRALGTVSLTLARVFGTSPMLTPGKVRELRHPDWRCENGPLSRALGWEPRMDLATALRRM